MNRYLLYSLNKPTDNTIFRTRKTNSVTNLINQ